jgi:hypothetical protein
MQFSDTEILVFVSCAFILILDAVLGRARIAIYYRLGVPVASFNVAMGLEEAMRNARESRLARLYVRALTNSSYGIRYGFLGNWIPSFTKLTARSDGETTQIWMTLNWGCTLLLAALSIQFFLRPEKIMIGFLLALVLLMIWFQYDETASAIKKPSPRSAHEGNSR